MFWSFWRRLREVGSRRPKNILQVCTAYYCINDATEVPGYISICQICGRCFWRCYKGSWLLIWGQTCWQSIPHGTGLYTIPYGIGLYFSFPSSQTLWNKLSRYPMTSLHSLPIPYEMNSAHTLWPPYIPYELNFSHTLWNEVAQTLLRPLYMYNRDRLLSHYWASHGYSKPND